MVIRIFKKYITPYTKLVNVTICFVTECNVNLEALSICTYMTVI